MDKVFVISDLHLGGDNSAKNLIHLISFFQDDDQFKNSKIVIAGDMLDSWSQTGEKQPPSYTDMTNTYSIVWRQIIRRAQKTPTYFVNGNHDMDLKLIDIGVKDIIQIQPDTLCSNIFQNRLYIDHGNCVDLFNANPGSTTDPICRYPLGYYKTRLNHTFEYKNEPIAVAPMQKDHVVNIAKFEAIQKIYSYKKEGKKISDDLLAEISLNLIEGLKRDIKTRFNVNDINTVTCVMDNGDKFSYGEILNCFDLFVYKFYHNNFLPSLSEDQRSDQYLYDNFARSIDTVQTGGLFWYSKSIFDLYRADTIVFGHTHMNQLIPANMKHQKDTPNFVYANSGCWCNNPMGPNVSSIEIELDDNTVISRNKVVEW